MNIQTLTDLFNLAIRDNRYQSTIKFEILKLYTYLTNSVINCSISGTVRLFGDENLDFSVSLQPLAPI